MLERSGYSLKDVKVGRGRIWTERDAQRSEAHAGRIRRCVPTLGASATSNTHGQRFRVKFALLLFTVNVSLL